jgi:hypothetical protein
MYVTALPAMMRSVGLHVLPGIVCVILASALLFFWELRRLTRSEETGFPRWLLPAAGIALGVLSFAFIAVRFAAIH